MPLLQVRDIPEHLYRLLAEQADKERRSLAQQAVAVLARGLEVELDAKARRQKVLRAIRESGQMRPLKVKDPAKLIREDRRR
ncbi:MAG TPA: hypothetical protein VH157_09270 [Bryobacteraceae bacterium]|jgi:hypothetical protein|nr:hypothetical protein [Bryobacteraceae bacterium]